MGRAASSAWLTASGSHRGFHRLLTSRLITCTRFLMKVPFGARVCHSGRHGQRAEPHGGQSYLMAAVHIVRGNSSVAFTRCVIELKLYSTELRVYRPIVIETWF